MTHRANTVTVAMETDTYYLLTFNFCVRINFNFKKALKLMFSVFIIKKKNSFTRQPKPEGYWKIA